MTKNTEEKEKGIEELIADMESFSRYGSVTITKASLTANAPNPESKKAIEALEKATEVVYQRKLSFEYTDGGPIVEYRVIKTPDESRTILRDFGKVLGFNVDIISDEKIMEAIFEIKNLEGARIFLNKDKAFPENLEIGEEKERNKKINEIYTEQIHTKPTIPYNQVEILTEGMSKGPGLDPNMYKINLKDSPRSSLSQSLSADGNS